MKTVFYADKFFLTKEVTGPGYLTVENGKFYAFDTKVSFDDNDTEIVDYSGHWIAPGLVDTHIHGFDGYDVMDNNFEGLQKISEGLLSCGVTSFLPTTLTSSIEQLDQVVQMIGERKEEVSGAKIKGIFLEGPFFTEKYKGAQNPKYFSNPSIDILKEWQSLSRGSIKKIAIAPELEGVTEFIEYAKSEEIAVALGHSSATYAEAKEAVDHGASIFVHTYNGMRGLHHREPGMVGAAMSLSDCYAELICDGHHVHPVSAKILMDARGRDRTALITDCMMAGGMPEGSSYSLGEFPVVVKDGAARLESGSLAGSILQLKKAVKNVVDWGIAAPEEAVYMGSTVPAESVNLDRECGKIEKDFEADFIVLSPQMELQATYLNGECRYKVTD